MGKSPISIIHILVIILLMVVATAIIFPILAGGETPTKVSCLSQMKQISTSTMIYAGDFDDRMPLDNWNIEVMPYLRNEALLHCPELQRIAEKQKAKVINRYGYAMHLTVMGKRMNRVSPKEIMLFETDALGAGVVANLAARNHTRHRKTSNVVYMDTSGKSIPLKK